MSGIYMIQNKANKKFYIGQTTKSFEERWDEHQNDLNADRHHNPHLQNAWKKYGEAAFEFHPLWKLPPDPKLLNTYEKIMIGDFYNDRSRCYNLKEGGGNGRHSEETKRKISETLSGEKNPNWGKKYSEETKQKMSEAATGKPKSEEHKQAISKAAKNRSEEHRQKLSEAAKNRSEETKRKMSEAAKNRPRKTCPWCGKSITAANFVRWHGNNCKHKEA